MVPTYVLLRAFLIVLALRLSRCSVQNVIEPASRASQMAFPHMAILRFLISQNRKPQGDRVCVKDDATKIG